MSGGTKDKCEEIPEMAKALDRRSTHLTASRGLGIKYSEWEPPGMGLVHGHRQLSGENGRKIIGRRGGEPPRKGGRPKYPLRSGSNRPRTRTHATAVSTGWWVYLWGISGGIEYIIIDSRARWMNQRLWHLCCNNVDI